MNQKMPKDVKKSVWGFFKRMFGWSDEVEEHCGYTFAGRLSFDDISDFVEHALGRRLTKIEADALAVNYRPQGLLAPEDRYEFCLASPRYRGTFAPVIEVFGTAFAGYADGEPLLKLAETVSVHFDDGVDVIDDELVAAV